MVIPFGTSTQKIAARSRTEADLVTKRSSCTKQGIYLCGILGKLGWRTFRSTLIFCDNKGAVLLAEQGSYNSQRKHIVVRLMELRDWIIDGKFIIDHVSTKSQLNDNLTKFMSRPILIELLKAISNRA